MATVELSEAAIANSELVPYQRDAGGAIRCSQEGGIPTYNCDQQFTSDSTRRRPAKGSDV
jgi:hypothetical protein